MVREQRKSIEGPQKRIAVFGGGSACDAETAEKAAEVGRFLAEEDVVVYCGGRKGVMEAVCRGVADAGGTVVGILPDDHCGNANGHVTIPVATGVGQARNVIIANSVHGAIAIAGQYGTLSEIAHTLGQGKPVVGLGSWEIKGVDRVATAEDAVTRILALI